MPFKTVPFKPDPRFKGKLVVVEDDESLIGKDGLLYHDTADSTKQLLEVNFPGIVVEQVYSARALEERLRDTQAPKPDLVIADHKISNEYHPPGVGFIHYTGATGDSSLFTVGDDGYIQPDGSTVPKPELEQLRSLVQSKLARRLE